MAERDAGIPDPVVETWHGVEQHWDERARHDAFVAQVAVFSCYAWAAARYREHAGDPIAEAQLDRLRKAATATLLATATSRPKATAGPYRSSLIALFVLVLMMAIGVAYAMARDGRATASSPDRR